MNDAASQIRTLDRGRRDLPARAGDDLENAHLGRTDGPLARDGAIGFRARGRQPLHLPDDAGRGMGRHDPVRSFGRDAERTFRYSWKGGHHGNVGYGSRLDTVVAFTLEKAKGGTRLRVVHSGFVLPRNDTAYRSMSGGWKKVVPRIGAIAGEHASS